MHLHQAIQAKVNAWREAGYPSPDYPAVAEILEYATIPQDDGGVQLRVLRAAQLRALETYWYLRMVEGTPHIFDLYQRYHGGSQDHRYAGERGAGDGYCLSMEDRDVL